MHLEFKKKFVLSLISIVLLPIIQVFALTLPEKPSGYVNDYANILSPSTKTELESTLRGFEKETSNQVVVVTFESLKGESLEDFSVRLATKWEIGTKKKDNGILLLIFKKEHEIRIEAGYGLEGALPDAICSLIIRNEIVPAFKQGNFDQGVIKGINAIIKATKGEYKNDSSQADQLDGNKTLIAIALFLYFVFPILAFLIIILVCTQFMGFPFGLIVGIGIIIILAIIRKIFFPSFFGQTFYGSGRRYNNDFFGGGFSGGFGGFSGGGGSFGGGGASGRW